MAKRLAEIRWRLANPVGHGNAGLASNFVDLAHVKPRPGGILALVLPAACVSGGSWANFRCLLESEYEDLTVLTIAAHGQTDRAFSADTGMAEALVVATKRREGRNEEDGETLFVNLYHRPGSIAEAFEMARAVRQGRLCGGDRETVGTYPGRPCGSARNDAGGYRPRSSEKDAPTAARVRRAASDDSSWGPWRERVAPPRHFRKKQQWHTARAV